MANEGFLDVVTFITIGHPDDNKRQPRSVGYAKRSGDKLYVTMQLVPLPDADGKISLVIEKRQPREGQSQPSQPTPQTRARGRS